MTQIKRSTASLEFLLFNFVQYFFPVIEIELLSYLLNWLTSGCMFAGIKLNYVLFGYFNKIKMF